jgi:hypothetical protein
LLVAGRIGHLPSFRGLFRQRFAIQHRGLSLSETAVGVGFPGKLPVRAHSNEVDVKTLVSPTIFGQAVAVALKVFEIYSPALLLRIVRCRIMLSARRALTDFSDVVADLSRQIVDVMRVPRGISIHGAPLGYSLKFVAK